MSFVIPALDKLTASGTDRSNRHLLSPLAVNTNPLPFGRSAVPASSSLNICGNRTYVLPISLSPLSLALSFCLARNVPVNPLELNSVSRCTLIGRRGSGWRHGRLLPWSRWRRQRCLASVKTSAGCAISRFWRPLVRCCRRASTLSCSPVSLGRGGDKRFPGQRQTNVSEFTQRVKSR